MKKLKAPHEGVACTVVIKNRIKTPPKSNLKYYTVTREQKNIMDSVNIDYL